MKSRACWAGGVSTTIRSNVTTLRQLVELLDSHVLLGARQSGRDVPVNRVGHDRSSWAGLVAYRPTSSSKVPWASSITAQAAWPARPALVRQPGVARCPHRWSPRSARRRAGSIVTTQQRRPARAPWSASAAAVVVLPPRPARRTLLPWPHRHGPPSARPAHWPPARARRLMVDLTAAAGLPSRRSQARRHRSGFPVAPGQLAVKQNGSSNWGMGSPGRPGHLGFLARWRWARARRPSLGLGLFAGSVRLRRRQPDSSAAPLRGQRGQGACRSLRPRTVWRPPLLQLFSRLDRLAHRCLLRGGHEDYLATRRIRQHLDHLFGLRRTGPPRRRRPEDRRGSGGTGRRGLLRGRP